MTNKRKYTQDKLTGFHAVSFVVSDRTFRHAAKSIEDVNAWADLMEAEYAA